MKKFLLLFLIGTTCTINAQKLNKAFSKSVLNAKLISPREMTTPDYKKNTEPYYSSSEATKVGPGWINISEEQIKAGGGTLTRTLFSLVMYPDTTVSDLSSSGSLRRVTTSGYGQTINFNNEALSAATDYQFITNRDTVNIDTIRLNYRYVRSKTMAADKSDSIFVSFGVVPRNVRANWVGSVRGYNTTSKNPKATSYPFPKCTGNSAEGFQKIFPGTGIAGLKTVPLALVSGKNSSTVPIKKKLINDSLFIYYLTYKPAELAPANDTIYDWSNRTRGKYSSFKVVYRSESASNRKRYFDDQNLTPVTGFTRPISYTTNFFQFANARYGLTSGTSKVTWLSVRNIYGIATEFYVSGNSTLSTNEKLAPKFAMAPNPANNTLSINFKEMGEKSIEIVDMVGRVINQYATNNANSFSTNDIANLPNGLYFVKITNNLGISSTKKLIVNHY